MRTALLRAVGVAAVAAVAVAGCSQNTGSGSGSSGAAGQTSAAGASGSAAAGGSGSASASGAATSGSSAAGSGSGSATSQAPGAPCNRTVQDSFTLPSAQPAGFKKGFTIALVRQSGIGDYFQQWGNGAAAQIKAAGGTVKVYDARGNNGTQVTMFDQAINAKPNAIIVDHGLADSVNPKIDEAIKDGIPVVVYDVDISNCAAMYISQNDKSIATKILDYMKEQNPSGGNVAYVNVSGIAPLDTRNGVYQQFLKDNPSFKQVAYFGKYTASTAADTASQGAAALKAAPNTNMVFCAYDELCKGTLIALRQDKMTANVKVYGVDTSTADIQLMTAAGSPWRASAATDPANVGAIVARAAIAAAAGVHMPEKMTVPAALITQDMLRAKKVANMTDLRKAIPDLSTPNILAAPWIPEIKPGQ